MRVAIDARKIDDFGIGTYIRGLLGGLAGLSDDAEYVVFAPAGARDRIPAAFEHVVFDAPKYSLRELFAVASAAAKAGADVIHAPHYVVPMTRIPVVTTIHDLIHLRMRHRNPAALLYARTMLARAVRKSARLLTVSEFVKRDLVESLGAKSENIVVTPNGVDPRFTAEGPATRRERPYLLFVGNDKPHKNCDALVEAFARSRASASVELLLAGGRFDRFANRRGIIATGFVPDEELPSLYRGAVAVVVPSIDEGFGLPALEAMACGTAVITSTAPALVEITADASLHVDAGDIDALAAAIDGVVFDEALRRDCVARGLVRARAFTWWRCAALTRDVYRAARR